MSGTMQRMLKMQCARSSHETAARVKEPRSSLHACLRRPLPAMALLTSRCVHTCVRESVVVCVRRCGGLRALYIIAYYMLDFLRLYGRWTAHVKQSVCGTLSYAGKRQTMCTRNSRHARESAWASSGTAEALMHCTKHAHLSAHSHAS